MRDIVLVHVRLVADDAHRRLFLVLLFLARGGGGVGKRLRHGSGLLEHVPAQSLVSRATVWMVAGGRPGAGRRGNRRRDSYCLRWCRRRRRCRRRCRRRRRPRAVSSPARREEGSGSVARRAARRGESGEGALQRVSSSFVGEGRRGAGILLERSKCVVRGRSVALRKRNGARFFVPLGQTRGARNAPRVRRTTPTLANRVVAHHVRQENAQRNSLRNLRGLRRPRCCSRAARGRRARSIVWSSSGDTRGGFFCASLRFFRLFRRYFLLGFSSRVFRVFQTLRLLRRGSSQRFCFFRLRLLSSLLLLRLFLRELRLNASSLRLPLLLLPFLLSLLLHSLLFASRLQSARREALFVKQSAFLAFLFFQQIALVRLGDRLHLGVRHRARFRFGFLVPQMRSARL
mmetsp:Transcript_7565/g.31451  ORF Transcript_7565/g.31451 Transcript_7565/m.31451 type:complete len:402 (+) Transcript_7565:300-1505(+)